MQIESAQFKAMASSAGLARRILQSPSTSTMSQNYSMNGKIIVSSLAILFFIVFIIILLHIYAKCLRRSSRIISGGRQLHHSLFYQDTAPTGGLDREIVKALPIFTYKPPCLSQASEPDECVVCLSDVQQDETCKLLPKCKHFFHMSCIDMWFLSNTTCPLCRSAADPNSDCGEVHDVDGSVSCCFTKQDGGNELEERPVTPISGIGDGIACDNSNDTPLRGHFSLQLPATSQKYRRSKSEKFFQGTPLAANVLWGNHTHTTTRMNRTCWQTGGRSFSHTTIDIFKPQESLVEVSSCPVLPDSPELCSNLSHLVHRPVANSSH